MLKSKLALVLPFALLTLVGCSSSDSRFEPVDPPDVDNVIDLKVRWYRSTGGVDDFYSELTPAFDEQNVYTAARDGDVVSLRQDWGRKNWSIDLDKEEENAEKRSARLSGGVAINGNKLAVGSENGYVYLLNKDDGSIIWKKNIPAEVVALPCFSQSGDKLFVLDSQGNFTALSTADGEVLWVTGDAPQPLRLRSQANPLILGDQYVLVGTSSGKINVLLQETGALVNQITVGQAVGINDLERISDVATSPLILGNVLYAASSSGSLVQYDLSTLAYLGHLGYQSTRDFAFDANSLVVTADDGTVSCLNRADGSQRWSNTQLSWRNVTAPVVFGDYAVVGDFEGYIYLLDMQDGSIDYMDNVDNSGFYVAAKVRDGRLFAQARDGSVYNLAFKDESLRPRAQSVEKANAQELADSISQVLSLNLPGVSEGGIYAPAAVDEEKLEARRDAIRKAVARQEAAIAAQERAARQAARARAEYEARVKAAEQERRERLSGFGIAPGIRSEIKKSQEN